MNPQKLKTYLTLRGAADLVQRDPAVITRAVASGSLPHYVTGCGLAKLIKRGDVLKWAKSASPGRPTRSS